MCNTENTGDARNKVNRTKQNKVQFHPIKRHESPEGE